MTDEEKYAAQGRAYAEAKEARSNIALLKIFFAKYARQLNDAKAVIEDFASDPARKTSDQRSMADHAKSSYRELASEKFQENADELLKQVERLRDLEEQIKNF